MIRDYWVWQYRKTEVPWALYIVKEFQNPQTFENTYLDVTIYSEDIDNEEHCISFVCWQFDTVTGYVDEIERHISKFSNFKPDDYRQVESAIFKILMDR